MNSKQVGNANDRKTKPGFKYVNVNCTSDEQLKLLDRVFTLGKLCGAIIHELRQPLAAILSNAQTARSILKNESFNLAELREIIDDIIGDDKRAAELMHRLRAFFAQDTSRYEKFDFNELVKDSVKIVHSSLKIHNIKLSQSLDPQLLQVYADRVQLQQVLINLFLNAIEAMSETALDQRELKLRSENRNNNICFQVSDTGNGVPASVMNRLFEPFFTTKDEGMGIGLSMAFSIVAEHGGDIEAFNNPGRGATFSLTLPYSSKHLNS